LTDAELTYEQALELLDQKLRALEETDLTLESALETVDEARKYLKICNDRLEAARQKIEVRAAAAAPAEDDAVPEGRLL
jgi:exodeoxyribonuclease VII small subunit